jgi:ppGpp synthetase/RelA/SpoT-type nucleotidyltranferase/HAMP domain-containing protein
VTELSTHPASPREAPDRRLSLGWRLGLITAAIVTLVIGTITYFQQRLEINWDLEERRGLLEQLLAPLVANLEAASNLSEMAQVLAQVHQGCPARGCPRIRLELRNSDGQMVASSDKPRTGEASSGRLYNRVPVFSRHLPDGVGMLAIWRDDGAFEAETSLRWRFWLLNIGLTAFCILACLLVADRFLITRPLRNLIRGVRQIARGNVQGLAVQDGPWEWRWLANQIRALGSELEETVRRLVEAERRALRGCPPSELPSSPGEGEFSPSTSGAVPSLEKLESGAHRASLQHQLLRRYFLDVCRMLESQDLRDPVVRGYAREAWERDVAEAERVGESNLARRLDDAALRALHPQEYARVDQALAARTRSCATWIRKREAEFQSALELARVPVVQIQYRVKHTAGVWRKMRLDGLSVEQVQDLFAFRLIVPELPHCYQALDVVHRRFEPQLLSFKDYVLHPKENGYQSIHTYVRDTAGMTFEVQIRSAAMHERADQGNAAHWRYKAERQLEMDEARRARGWLGNLLPLIKDGRIFRFHTKTPIRLKSP